MIQEAPLFLVCIQLSLRINEFVEKRYKSSPNLSFPRTPTFEVPVHTDLLTKLFTILEVSTLCCL